SRPPRILRSSIVGSNNCHQLDLPLAWQIWGGQQDQFDLAPQRLLEIQQRKDQERALKRQLREAEGGRGGGFNDRQIVERKSADDEDDCEYDDFGRRRKTAPAADWRAKLKQKKEGGRSSGGAGVCGVLRLRVKSE
ncbi:unnamed protein product, partial [Prorocentrum cordatum]